MIFSKTFLVLEIQPQDIVRMFNILNNEYYIIKDCLTVL